MWSTISTAVEFMINTIASIGDRISILALEILRGSRFSGLFLTVALTGSLSAAFAVLFIGWIWPEAKSGC